MKKIKNAIANVTFIDIIGSVLLYGVIVLILTLFIFHTVNYIPHFVIR
jgi:hypothetical protein